MSRETDPLRSRIENALSGLPNLKVQEFERTYEISWGYGRMCGVAKSSTPELAKVNWEANPYNPRETEVPWSELSTWARKNVGEK